MPHTTHIRPWLAYWGKWCKYHRFLPRTSPSVRTPGILTTKNQESPPWLIAGFRVPQPHAHTIPSQFSINPSKLPPTTCHQNQNGNGVQESEREWRPTERSAFSRERWGEFSLQHSVLPVQDAVAPGQGGQRGSAFGPGDSPFSGDIRGHKNSTRFRHVAQLQLTVYLRREHNGWVAPIMREPPPAFT